MQDRPYWRPAGTYPHPLAVHYEPPPSSEEEQQQQQQQSGVEGPLWRPAGGTSGSLFSSKYPSGGTYDSISGDIDGEPMAAPLVS